MNVAFLPTGRTEWQGLAIAMKALFPAHDFYCLPSPEEITSYPDDFPFPGFTSTKLQSTQVENPPESAIELVSRAAQEALGDRKKAAADIVVIVDDVELPNMNQVSVIVDVMRAAAIKHLNALSQTGHFARTQKTLVEKVSFHLIKPMIESWFFADPKALANAGVPATQPVHFLDATDPEDFNTTDSLYLVARESDCTALAALAQSKKKKLRPKWLGSQPRGHHPKGYLQWLCRDANERSCTRYHETEDGGRAIAAIDWACLLGRSAAQFSLLRAMIEDLEDGLSSKALVPTPGPATPQPTSRIGAHQDAVLRNI